MLAQPAPMLSVLMASLAPRSGDFAANMPKPSAAKAVIATRSQLRSGLRRVLELLPPVSGCISVACCCGRKGSCGGGDRGDSMGGLAPLFVTLPAQVSILGLAVEQHMLWMGNMSVMNALRHSPTCWKFMRRAGVSGRQAWAHSQLTCLHAAS